MKSFGMGFGTGLIIGGVIQLLTAYILYLKNRDEIIIPLFNVKIIRVSRNEKGA